MGDIINYSQHFSQVDEYKEMYIKIFTSTNTKLHSIEEKEKVYFSIDKLINPKIIINEDLTKTKKADGLRYKIMQQNKNKVLRLLDNEDIAVGFSSLTERFFSDLLDRDTLFLLDLLNLIYKENFDNVELMQKFIEVMSNLDYKALYPTNTILALGVINHTNIGIQEAAIAAFEKWDDKNNLTLLKNINYTTPWVEEYAKNVIQYLESC